MVSTGCLLYLDCVGGVAGDMLLAALYEAAGGIPTIDELPQRLGFADTSLVWSHTRPGGLLARRLEVRFDPDAHPHHRRLGEIYEILERAELPLGAAATARKVFRCLAEAEGAVHGEGPEQVCFHEVGAVDALVDIVGIALAVEQLGIEEVVCSALPMGSGAIETAHGTLPLPVPAVAQLLPGVPVYPANIEGETVTPTGAAVIKTLARHFGTMPAMTVQQVGVGAGSRSYPGLANVVRAFVGTPREHLRQPEQVDTNFVVECNVDDLDPRIIPVIVERLMTVGALDAYVQPIVMKKGRPGHLLAALVSNEVKMAAVRVLLHETTTLGCRAYPVTKYHLERRMETVQTPWGPVPVKVALDDEQVIRRVPEFEPCAELARQAGVPVREVLEAANKAGEKPPSSSHSSSQE